MFLQRLTGRIWREISSGFCGNQSVYFEPKHDALIQSFSSCLSWEAQGSLLGGHFQGCCHCNATRGSFLAHRRLCLLRKRQWLSNSNDNLTATLYNMVKKHINWMALQTKKWSQMIAFLSASSSEAVWSCIQFMCFFTTCSCGFTAVFSGTGCNLCGKQMFVKWGVAENVSWLSLISTTRSLSIKTKVSSVESWELFSFFNNHRC